MTELLIGTPAQVRYARSIQTHFLSRVGGRRDLLPDVPLASFWIEQRNVASLRDLWDAASDSAGQLLYSPFVSHYPRWGRAEAVATLRLLDRFAVLDLETDGLGKAAQVLEVAVVDQDGVPLFASLIRPVAMTCLDGIDDCAAHDSRSIHGITAQMLANAPTLPDVWPRLVTVLTEPETRPLTAFNADFDLRIIRTAAAREGVQVPALQGLCLMKLSTAYYAHDYFLSLDEAGTLAGVARGVPEPAHRALGDARYTARMVQRLRLLASGWEAGP
jgi:DNA polymerase III epsilon subunit-like protein